MFLPNDMTSDERQLAATITRQLLDRRRPATASEEATVRLQADEVAAETIWAHRAEHNPIPENDEDEDLPETGYHSRLRDRLERQQAILDEEAAEIEASLTT